MNLSAYKIENLPQHWQLDFPLFEGPCHQKRVLESHKNSPAGMLSSTVTISLILWWFFCLWNKIRNVLNIWELSVSAWNLSLALLFRCILYFEGLFPKQETLGATNRYMECADYANNRQIFGFIFHWWFEPENSGLCKPIGPNLQGMQFKGCMQHAQAFPMQPLLTIVNIRKLSLWENSGQNSQIPSHSRAICGWELAYGKIE